MLRSKAAAFAALLGGLTCGCSDERIPQGQLMLAFDSDMSIPKDVNLVELRAGVGQEGLFTIFEVGPLPANRLPGTFGIRAEDGAQKIVEITLNAGKDELTRTIANAEANIPNDRVALLRMPIQWLCTLRVSEDEDGNPVSDCEEGETCNAGRCDPAAIDEDELPTYHPDDVFGPGGVGDGETGLCFSTEACFLGNAGTVITDLIDASTCRIELSSETDNFGLRVRGGDGVCVTPELCLVTLNRSAITGWFEVDEDGNAAEGGGFAQLPEIICEELDPTGGAILDVYRADCDPQKVPSLPLCGPWSSAGPGLNDDPGVLCAEVGSGKAGQEIIDDPVVASLIDASTDFRNQGDALLADLGQACVEIAGALELEDTWSELGYDTQSPTTASVLTACDAATIGLVDGLVAVERMKADVAPGHCTVDTTVQTDCEEFCSPEDSCAESDRCPPESSVATCPGDCGIGSTCQGTVASSVSCNGACSGVCKGTCEGLCTRIGTSAPCEGICEGLCAGQCAGSCQLEAPQVCGTGTTCLGECDRTSGEVTCAVPLAECEDVDPRCGPLCATRASAETECELGGLFVAKTELDVVDQDLETTLEEQALPNLTLIEDVRVRALLVEQAESQIDFDEILDQAEAVGERERACSVLARDLIEPIALRTSALAEAAQAILDAVRAVPARRPNECILLLAGDACQACIGQNCCREAVACIANGDCLSLPSDGEVPCVIDCLDAAGVVNDLTKADCASQCVRAGAATLLDESVDLLTCIGSNTAGTCELDCYGAETTP